MEQVQGNLHWEGKEKKILTKKFFKTKLFFGDFIYFFVFLNAINNPITTYEKF